jgi:hypothetical protein
MAESCSLKADCQLVESCYPTDDRQPAAAAYPTAAGTRIEWPPIVKQTTPYPIHFNSWGTWSLLIFHNT